MRNIYKGVNLRYIMIKATKTFTLDIDVLQELEKEPNASQLINAQLVAYFKLAEKRAAKLQVQAEEEADKVFRTQNAV